MGTARIVWARDAAEQIRKHDAVQQATSDLAEGILREVQAFAPQDTGDYVRGLEIVEVVGADGVPQRIVRAGDPISAVIEFGSGPREDDRGANRGEMPALAPLQRAVDGLGLRLAPASDG